MAEILRGEASIRVTDEEHDTLQKACNIVAGLKHQWWLQDDNADDDERYWMMSTMLDSFKEVFEITEEC